MAMNNGGISKALYGNGANASTGILPIKSGPQNYPTFSWCFWNPEKENAIVFAPYKTSEWKFTKYDSWPWDPTDEMLNFYAKENDSYMWVGVYVPKRHWAVSVIPESDVVINGLTNGRTYVPQFDEDMNFVGVDNFNQPYQNKWGAGPDVRLWEKLTDFSLNFYKDIIFDFEEDLNHTFSIPSIEPTMYSYSAYKVYTGSNMESRWLELADRYWNHQADLSGIHFGHHKPSQIIDYLESRNTWTKEEREHVRSWYIWLANALLKGENALSGRYTALMGGQPNFFVPWMMNLAVIAAAFPEHPDSQVWKQAAEDQIREWFRQYVRKDDVVNNAVGGRFTENPICYNYASLGYLLRANYAFMDYDGSNIFDDNPVAWKWAKWNLSILIPNMEYADGFRLPPSEGAHANAALFIENAGYNESIAYLAEQLLMSKDDEARLLGENYKWVATRGEEGTRPELKSTLYTDYGPVMHYGVPGEADEAYLHLSVPHGRNYRWGDNNFIGGTIFYSADNYNWSWNNMEDNGDKTRPDYISSFYVTGNGHNTINRGIRSAPSDNVLYDFNFAQEYFANADPNTADVKTAGRGVMMIRNDYIAILDDLRDKSYFGKFNWANQTNRGCSIEHFENPDFTHPTHKITGIRAKGDGRFPIAYNMYGEEDVNDFALNAKISDYNSFSVRFSGKWLPTSTSITFTRGLGPNDKSKLYINGVEQEFINDVAVVNFANTTDYVDFRYDYQHNPDGLEDGGMIRCTLRMNDGISNDWFKGDYFHNQMDMPYIFPPLNPEPVKGDQLHIVAPIGKVADTVLTEWGANVTLSNGATEYVFYTSERSEEKVMADDRASFRGHWGYAAKNQIALFKGSKVSFDDLMIEKTHEDFGVSAELVGNEIIGRYAGTQGGSVTITLPDGFSANPTVIVDGQQVFGNYQNGKVTFDVSISKPEGVKHYRIIGM